MHDWTWHRAEQAQRVRTQIWRYVSPSAARTDAVLPLAVSLLALPRQDTRFLTSLHLLLAPETTRLLEHAPSLLRQLTTSTTAPLDEHPERIAGPVDWAATLAASAARGRRYAYATRPPARDYATAENRLLFASLAAVTDAAHALGWQPATGGVGAEVQHKAELAARLLRVPMLRHDVGAPETRDTQRVEKGRAARRFHPVSQFWRLHDRLDRLQDRHLLQQLVESTALLAASDGTLLEVLVLFDTLTALQHRGWAQRTLGLVHGQVRITHQRGQETLNVHYQAHPPGLTSTYTDILRAHRIPTTGLRPDLVLDHHRPHHPRVVTIIEVKYRVHAADAVRDALFDLLAYQQTYQATSADMRFIGVGWGQGLQPSPGSPVLLCTPDRIPDALALVD